MASLHDIVKKGSTNRSVTLRIIDSTAGTPETGVVFNTAGIDLWYRREGGARVAITEATLAALTTAHADGGFLHISDGEYRLDLPDAAYATGAQHVDFGGTVTGMVVIGGRVRLVDYDPEDAADLGLTAITGHTPQTGDSFARLGAAGASLTDLGGMSTAMKAQVNTEADTAATDYAAAKAGDAMALTSGERTTLAAVIWNSLTSGMVTAGSIGKKLADWVIHSAADVWAAATRVLTANTNLNDPTSAAIADAVLDEALAGHVAAGTLGKKITDIPTTAMRGTDLAALDATAAKEATVAALNNLSTADVIAALEDAGLVMLTTTIATLASQTSFTLTAGSPDNAAYRDCIIVIEDAATAAQKAVVLISSYTAATKTIVLASDPGIFTMAAGDKVRILPMVPALGEWSNGGRLDLLLDAIKVVTDLLNLDGSGNVTLADGTHGGTSAVLTLERLIAVSTTAGQPGIKATGSGTAAGLSAQGGATGSGILAQGGGTSGSGIAAQGNVSAANAAGMECNGRGTGSGVKATGGATGIGIEGQGGATSGHGIRGIAVAGNSHGMSLVKNGTGKDIDADEIDAILIDTGTTIPALLPAALVGGRMDCDVGAKTGNVALSAQEKLDVNTEADTALTGYGAPTKAEMDTAHALLATVAKQDLIKAVTDALGATAAANLAKSAGAAGIISGTVDTVVNTHTPTTTVFQADDITEATADHYKGRVVIFTSGALLGQATDITAYALVGTIGQLTVTALTEAPANNDTFIIV